MKYVTFNIRVDVESDGINKFSNRKDYIVKKILEEKPDIIGFQEVLDHVAVFLRENLKDYTIVGCGREKDLSGEQMSVMFRTDRFKMLKYDTYWMSETPFVPGSRYVHQSDCPRTCTEVLLYDLVSKRVIRVINTHLDHIDSEARLLGLRQILNKDYSNSLFSDAAIILSGDFNAEPESIEISEFKKYPGFTNQTENIGITYHGFEGENPEKIDYIFTKGDFKKISMEKWEEKYDDIWLSDHFPVCVTFKD